ncbi:hypothetical protein GCM10010222_77070 [Streptomyces tanashiensis]|nr:hypothetical protein GCM10010222_77070 [Streptomyces tanashiensis]
MRGCPGVVGRSPAQRGEAWEAPWGRAVRVARGGWGRWWDDPSGDPQSDEWWDELDGKKRRER